MTFNENDKKNVFILHDYEFESQMQPSFYAETTIPHEVYESYFEEEDVGKREMHIFENFKLIEVTMKYPSGDYKPRFYLINTSTNIIYYIYKSVAMEIMVRKLSEVPDKYMRIFLNDICDYVKKKR